MTGPYKAPTTTLEGFGLGVQGLRFRVYVGSGSGFRVSGVIKALPILVPSRQLESRCS